MVVPELSEWRVQFDAFIKPTISRRAHARIRFLYNSILSQLSRPTLWSLLASSRSEQNSVERIRQHIGPALEIIDIVCTNLDRDGAWLASKTMLFGFVVMEINAVIRQYEPTIRTVALDACLRIFRSKSRFLRLTDEGLALLKQSFSLVSSYGEAGGELN